MKLLTADSDVSILQLLFARGLGLVAGALIGLHTCGVSGAKLGRSHRQVALLCVRAVAGFVSTSLGYVGASLLPLGESVTIVQTTPLWSAALAAVVLSEPWHAAEGVAACIALAGVLLVTRPPVLFGDSPDFPQADAWARRCGQAASLGCAWTNAVIFVLVRFMGSEQVHLLTLVAYQGAGTAALSATASALGAGGPWSPLTAHLLSGMVAIGILGLGGQICLTYGLQNEKTATAAMALSIDVPCAFLWQATVVPESNQHAVSALSALGGALIILSIVAVGVDKLSRDDSDPGRAASSSPSSTPPYHSAQSPTTPRQRTTTVMH